MARARNLKPSLFKNEILGTADPYLTILFQGLWCLADRNGILEDRPLRIKAEIFPYRDNFDINGYLTVLYRLEFIRRYKFDSIGYIQVLNFKKHQNPHHTEKESGFPEYSDSCVLTVMEPLNTGTTPADSLLLIPDSPILIPEPLNLNPSGCSAEKSAPPKTKVAGTGETWSAYSNAYFDRYGVGPVRNAKVNGQIVNFVKRIGELESPHVAAFYLGHNNAYYVKQMHSLDAMIKDAEKLRTEWVTQSQMTHTKAMQADKTQTNQDAFAPLLAEARLREANDGIQ